MPLRVGIDIGGTFTDLAAADTESGDLYAFKVPSTPADLARGAAAALAALGDRAPLDSVVFLAHGTTAGTNALLEGTGARTALLTTEGFRDLLEIARQKRPSLYDLRARKPRPLVPRRLRREAQERLRCDGAVIHPLDRDALKRELTLLASESIEALAICFLHSYANPAHERAARDLAAAILPDAYVTASCDLLPRFREYERLSTTVINAYLGPLMDAYLDQLTRRAAASGVGAVPHIMQSNAGAVPLDTARRAPASTVLSGPAAGAAAAARLCAELDIQRAISVDMGGTSTDVCLIEGGLPAVASGREVGGYLVELPGVDVRCVGAGGGSILSVDPAGLPQAGPRSAGAHPGPACYLRGGRQPTFTDACLALGRLGPRGLLDGQLPLDLDAARAALAAGLSGPLGVGVERAALGAVQLVVAGIRRAVDGITVAEGRDPRDFVLIAAGGAGPLIACELATELGIAQVVVPRWPGNFSACGLLASDLRRDWVETHLMPASPRHLPQMAEHFASLEGRARRWLAESQVPPDRRLLLRRAAARYAGQDYELDVEAPPGRIGQPQLREIAAAFHRAHHARYGYDLPDWPVEFVHLAVTAVGQVSWWPTGRLDRGDRSDGPAPPDTRPVFIAEREGFQPCPIHDRRRLRAGDLVDGPAIIEQHDSTTYLPPAHRARVDAGGNLRLTREAAP